MEKMCDSRTPLYFPASPANRFDNAYRWWEVPRWSEIEEIFYKKGADEGIADILEGYQLAELDPKDSSELREIYPRAELGFY